MLNKLCVPVFTGLLISSSLIAQTTDQKIVTETNKVNQTNSAVRGANTTIKDTKSTVLDVKNTVVDLFGKKKKNRERESNVKEVANVTELPKAIVIAISKIDYPMLKTLEDSLQKIKGVANTKKNFNAALSTIEVSFSGESDELWDSIPANLLAQFELKALEGNRITVDVKKPS